MTLGRPAWLLVAISLSAIAGPASGQNVCPPPWALEETLRLGSVSGEVTLTGVRDLEVGSDGRIYLTQSLVPQVSVFTSAGRPLPALGRGGQGPGEFQVLAGSMGWTGDTLWVSDYGGVHFFGRNSREAYQVRFRTAVPEQSSIFTPVRPLADGSFLGERLILGREMERFYLARKVPLLRFSRTGQILDTIALIDVGDNRVVQGERGANGRYDVLVPHPLNDWIGESLLPVAVTQDGTAILVIGAISRGRSSATFDLLRIGLGGDTLLARAITYQPAPILRAEAERLLDEFAGWYAGDYRPPAPLPKSPIVVEQERRLHRAAITLPEFYPPVRRIVAGHDGTIWLLRELRRDLVDRWEVYDASGRLEGAVDIREGKSSIIPWAPRADLLRATRDELWVSTIGEFDVPYVHRYRIRRSCP